MPTDGRDLIERCVAGAQEEAWEEFIERYGPALRRGVAAALGGRWSRPDRLEEDLLQEVYCRLIDRGARRLRRCRERDEPAVRAYLTRLAKNAAIDQLRARSTTRRGGRRPPPLDATAVVERARDPRPSIEERLILRQRGRRFLRRCRRVTTVRGDGRNLRILALAFLGGLSSREIARRLDHSLTPASIDSLISRARKRLAAEGLTIAARRSPAPPAAVGGAAGRDRRSVST